MIERGFSSAGQRRHRLPEQARAPIAGDIEFVFNEALRQPGELIELPWVHNKERYLLTAKLERRNNDQCHQWSFYQGDGPSCKLKWMYESSDVTKVHNLVMNSIPVARKSSYQSQMETLQLRPDEPVPPGQALSPQKRRTSTKSNLKATMDVLEGSLNQMPLASLLTSIASSHLTGRLVIQQQSVQTILHFEEGRLVGAEREGWRGEDAFFEVALSPQAGDFKFMSSDRGLNRNIQDRIDSLLLRAAALSDQNRFLEQAGLQPTSRLYRTNPNLTEREFEMAVANLVPVDMNSQKMFYQLIDNRSPLSEIVARSNLNRLVWTPIMFNLLSSRLLALDATQPPQMTWPAPSDATPQPEAAPKARSGSAKPPLDATPTLELPRPGQAAESPGMAADGTTSSVSSPAAETALTGAAERGTADGAVISENDNLTTGSRPISQAPVPDASTASDATARDTGANGGSGAGATVEAEDAGAHSEASKSKAKEAEPKDEPKGAEAELYQPASMEELGIDLDELETFTKSMTRSDTGIYSQIAFLYFLEHEFYRFHSYDTPFTVVLLSVKDKSQEKVGDDARRRAVELIKNTVRKADVLGHYDGDDYGVILPHTDAQGAQGLVNRLKNILSGDPYGKKVELLCGVAGIPHDCQDLLTLLTIAKHRKID